jgi:glutamate-5-semialdehyde dehydrogenase
MEDLAKRARRASRNMATLSFDERNNLLHSIHASLLKNAEAIFAANKEDLKNAKALMEQGKMSPVLAKRLDISGDKFKALLKGILDVAEMEDPIGKATLARELDQGLNLYRITCPIGVSLIIFESRPEVVVQISSLVLKSGNACILKGGKEAFHTNSILVKIISDAVRSSINEEFAIQYISDRDAVNGLLKMDKYVDLVIPRGGNALVKFVKSNTTIPVLGHADGICSVFVNYDADFEISKRVVVDSKTNYPAACNSCETLLIHKDFPRISDLLQELTGANITLKAHSDVFQLVKKNDKIVLATEEDFHTEFLDLVLAVKLVDDVNQAIDHINEHGSGHTDSILTSDENQARTFMRCVDSAGVYWNASTRFADGYRYGFGVSYCCLNNLG